MYHRGQINHSTEYHHEANNNRMSVHKHYQRTACLISPHSLNKSISERSSSPTVSFELPYQLQPSSSLHEQDLIHTPHLKPSPRPTSHLQQQYMSKITEELESRSKSKLSSTAHRDHHRHRTYKDEARNMSIRVDEYKTDRRRMLDNILVVQPSPDPPRASPSPSPSPLPIAPEKSAAATVATKARRRRHSNHTHNAALYDHDKMIIYTPTMNMNSSKNRSYRKYKTRVNGRRDSNSNSNSDSKEEEEYYENRRRRQRGSESSNVSQNKHRGTKKKRKSSEKQSHSNVNSRHHSKTQRKSNKHKKERAQSTTVLSSEQQRTPQIVKCSSDRKIGRFEASTCDIEQMRNERMAARQQQHVYMDNASQDSYVETMRTKTKKENRPQTARPPQRRHDDGDFEHREQCKRDEDKQTDLSLSSRQHHKSQSAPNDKQRKRHHSSHRHYHRHHRECDDAHHYNHHHRNRHESHHKRCKLHKSKRVNFNEMAMDYMSPEQQLLYLFDYATANMLSRYSASHQTEESTTTQYTTTGTTQTRTSKAQTITKETNTITEQESTIDASERSGRRTRHAGMSLRCSNDITFSSNHPNGVNSDVITPQSCVCSSPLPLSYSVDRRQHYTQDRPRPAREQSHSLHFLNSPATSPRSKYSGLSTRAVTHSPAAKTAVSGTMRPKLKHAHTANAYAYHHHHHHQHAPTYPATLSYGAGGRAPRRNSDHIGYLAKPPQSPQRQSSAESRQEHNACYISSVLSKQFANLPTLPSPHVFGYASHSDAKQESPITPFNRQEYSESIKHLDASRNTGHTGHTLTNHTMVIHPDQDEIADIDAINGDDSPLLEIPASLTAEENGSCYLEGERLDLEDTDPGTNIDEEDDDDLVLQETTYRLLVNDEEWQRQYAHHLASNAPISPRLRHGHEALRHNKLQCTV